MIDPLSIIDDSISSFERNDGRDGDYAYIHIDDLNALRALHSAAPNTLYISQRPDGKVHAWLTRPESPSDLFLAITFTGEIHDITHGGFFTVPISDGPPSPSTAPRANAPSVNAPTQA